MSAPADAPADPNDLTADRFLGGRLTILQPRRGHRSGIEAVLIAAAAPLAAGETIIDIGAGVGVAALCALRRVPGTRAVLVESDAALADLARRNVASNGFAERAEVIAADVAAPGAAAASGLAGAADHALANPPFYDPAASRISAAKASAHAAPAALLEAWLRFAAAAVRPGGTMTLVHRAEALPLVLEAIGRRFGGTRILPIHPRPVSPASRIIVQARKGSRAGPSLLPGLALHGPTGDGFSPALEAVLRDGAALAALR